MKHIIFFILMAFLGGCAITKAMSVPSGTSAGFTLKSDIVNFIDIQQRAYKPGCTYRITNINAVGSDQKVVLEEWVVEACGEEIVYLVKLMPSPLGGTTFSVGRK